MGFPDGSGVKNLPDNSGDTGLILGSGKSPGEGNGNPVQYSCLENPMDRGAWWPTVHGVTKESNTTKLQQHINICILTCAFIDLIYIYIYIYIYSNLHANLLILKEEIVGMCNILQIEKIIKVI